MGIEAAWLKKEEGFDNGALRTGEGWESETFEVPKPLNGGITKSEDNNWGLSLGFDYLFIRF